MNRVIERAAHGVMLLLGAAVATPARSADSTPAGAPRRHAAPLDIPGFQRIQRPQPDAVIPYGSAATQQGDLFVPRGRGPFPVVAMIHGGCWSSRTAGREQLRHLGADMAARGIAVWSLGYRRADEEGGGYPGTYQDVATGLDHLRELAKHHPLDLDRLVVMGHSAGGHLALWASGRDRLDRASPLRTADPLVPRRVVVLGGIGDLETFAPLIPGLCGEGLDVRLVGQADAARPDVYRDTSPARIGTSAARVVMVSGTLDRLVPPYVAHDYAKTVADGVEIKRVDIHDAGHFDLVAQGAAWRLARAHIEALLAR
ncbi:MULTISPECIES: alpha/beta hydrolase [unclassified Pseudoxanthomonas]|uniref:alpha/beta hydrolase family protein n=1 Tax=unclassified Pseudoxanthomonas TaxID=2645906 RepID=UPI0008E33D46|nr:MULTISPECIES: alpha/beta hydrolase [unclassified Pseudoxanthomonas]SFV26222.1 Acetyl esterase/lipase [Pseudoxanthomonas sp. YR558]